MRIKGYLEKSQPILYKTFLNAFKKNEISHAYLLAGEAGTPLKEVAMYLAKTLLCDKPSPLACEECLTCIRIDENQYSDIIVFDGEKSTIKKDDVDYITSTFSKTANESKGKVIYILHLIENMTAQAINALLKFLEEPGKETYAFLTTQNESRILPTIVSRAQRLTVKLIPRNQIILEVKEENIPVDDVELLSNFYNDVSLIKENYQNENYLEVKDCFNKLVNNLDNQNELIYLIDKEISPIIKSKENARMLLDMLSDFFTNIIKYKNQEDIFLKSYDKIIKDISIKLNNIESSLLEIISLRSKLDLNLNTTSLFEHLAIFINKE